jgi:hypothetical protein
VVHSVLDRLICRVFAKVCDEFDPPRLAPRAARRVRAYALYPSSAALAPLLVATRSTKAGS